MTTSKKSDGEVTKAFRFSKKVVIILLVSVAVFTVTMIVTYYVTDGVPDTLVTEFFGFFKIEGGVLGMIKAVETFIDIVKAHNDKPKKDDDENDETETITRGE